MGHSRCLGIKQISNMGEKRKEELLFANSCKAFLPPFLLLYRGDNNLPLYETLQN